MNDAEYCGIFIMTAESIDEISSKSQFVYLLSDPHFACKITHQDDLIYYQRVYFEHYYRIEDQVDLFDLEPGKHQTVGLN